MTVKLLNSYSNEKDLFGYYDKNNTKGSFFCHEFFKQHQKFTPLLKISNIQNIQRLII